MASTPAAPAGRPIEDALPDSHSWAGRPAETDLAPLPGCPAVYLLVNAAATPVVLATTQHLRRLAISRLTDPERPRRGKTDLAEIVRGVRWRRVHSPFEGRWWYWRLARQMHPREYRRLISFGPAWFLNVDWTAPLPEIRVTERIWCVAGECVGPWPTRKSCDEALEGLWDLFELCRHPEQVRKAPAGTRCAYAEMGRCDAPCDGSAALEVYRERCRAAWRLARGGVEEWIAAATERMKAAAREQHYERAALIKRQVAFAERWRTHWSRTVRPAPQFNELLAIPVTRRRAHKLYLFRRGHLSAGPVVLDRRLAVEGPKWLGEALARPAEPLDATVRMEQTWLVAHFLHHREAQAAICVPLPDAEVPPGLEGALRAALESRRVAGASADGSA